MKMKSVFCGLMLGLLLLAAETQTTHAAINYVEGPDLTSNLAIPTNLGSVSLGLNSVSGSLKAVTGVLGTFAGDSADSFKFIVPAGHIVTTIELSISNFTSSGGARGSRSELLGGHFCQFYQWEHHVPQSRDHVEKAHCWNCRFASSRR